MKTCSHCNKSKTEMQSGLQGTLTHYWVMCMNCGCRGPNELNTTRAIQMWNLRRREDVLRVLLIDVQNEFKQIEETHPGLVDITLSVKVDDIIGS